MIFTKKNNNMHKQNKVITNNNLFIFNFNINLIYTERYLWRLILYKYILYIQ